MQAKSRTIDMGTKDKLRERFKRITGSENVIISSPPLPISFGVFEITLGLSSSMVYALMAERKPSLPLNRGYSFLIPPRFTIRRACFAHDTHQQ